MTGDLAQEASFSVKLSNFEGPFDLLLNLIAKHKLDITEVALSEVTDEFIAYIRAQGSDWDLDRASSFLVVAATLLDLKTARLLPQGEVEDEADLALLEARDLLFARLLQYRAFKQVATWIGSVLDDQSKRVPRPGGLEEQFAVLLPEVHIGLTLDQFARLAMDAMEPKAQAEVSLDHVYAPTVSVAEQAVILAERLSKTASMSFRALTSDAETPLIIIARFLAILEMYRQSVVQFEQLNPLGELLIRWTGQGHDIEIMDEYDVPADHGTEGGDNE